MKMFATADSPSMVGIGSTRRSESSLRRLGIGLAFVAGALLVTLCASRDDGSTLILLALLTSVVALVCLGWAVRGFGIFSLGGITWAMVASLFIGRWFLPPVAAIYITPQAVSYYDRKGALIASSLMITVFALTYSIGARRPGGYLTGASTDTGLLPAPGAAASTSIADLVAASVLLVVLRLLTGFLFHIGLPGRQPAAVPLVGVIFYATSYGPLAGVALILWLGRATRSSSFMAGTILLADVLAESVLGSHGTAFLAVLVYGAARATIGRNGGVTMVRAITLAALIAVVTTGALLISFVARESLNGGARQSLGDVPAFLGTRFGGIEYVAPVIGAVNQTGSSMQNLRPSTWGRYMTADVYGLPPETRTGFAATAVGWWYGLRRLWGVGIGAAISGLLTSSFDRWTYARRRNPTRLSVSLAVGGLLGWATFFLGGTIGSLSGIAIGFTGIAMALAQGHRLVTQASSHDHQIPVR